jgi:hypothetical protein
MSNVSRKCYRCQTTSAHNAEKNIISGVRLGNASLRWNARIMAGSTQPVRGRPLAKPLYVSLTDCASKFKSVQWSHPQQLRRPFPSTDFHQSLKNIVSENKHCEYFSINRISRSLVRDRIRSTFSTNLLRDARDAL